MQRLRPTAKQERRTTREGCDRNSALCDAHCSNNTAYEETFARATWSRYEAVLAAHNSIKSCALAWIKGRIDCR